MNKWQIICPLVALLAAGAAVSWKQGREAVRAQSFAIGNDLVASTNSPHLTELDRDVHACLAKFLSSPARVADVQVGDLPPPAGDGSAYSLLMLTNAARQGLLLRLRPDKASDRLQIVGWRSFPE